MSLTELLLRPIEFEDLMLLKNYRNHPDIMRWCRQYRMLSYHDQQEWYRKINESDRVEMYAVCGRKETGDVDSKPVIIGVCGLTSIDLINRRAEFSLYIGKEHQNHGYARHALIELFKHGFNNLNLNLIWGETIEGNPAIKLFKKIGMFKEGTRRQFYYKDGRYKNAELYSITKDEFNEQ